MKNTKRIALGTAALVWVGAVVLAGCAGMPGSASDAELDKMAAQMMAASFRDQGIAKTERLKQDAAQEACSHAGPPSEADAKRIQAEALATIKPPAGGQYLGDWREGEKLAQNGRGMTWTDPSAAASANGGNCYNCHQISKAEISYGTIGPSLYNYGKLRGVTDPSSPAARPMVEYTWAKLYNGYAFNACSNMPRFGHARLLDETQLKNLMALLLDPKSPVNAQ